jgi:hypothetical protein
MYIDYSSNTWTASQRLYFRETMSTTCGIITLFLCLLAHVVYYKFPKLRVFPRSILSWLNLFNMFFACYLIWKWAPFSSLHHSWAVDIDPMSTPCRISLFIDNFTNVGLVSCDTLIAITIFHVLFFPGVLEQNFRKFYWGYLGWATIYPIAWGILAVFTFGEKQPVGVSCTVINEVQTAIVFQNIGFMCIQLLLITASLFRIKRVMNRVQTVADSNFPFKYLIARFLVTSLAQAFTLVPVQVQGAWVSLVNVAIYSRFAYLSRSMGPSLDALVFMLVNPDFVNWVGLQFSRLRHCSTRPKKEISQETLQARQHVTIELTEPTDASKGQWRRSESIDCAIVEVT